MGKSNISPEKRRDLVSKKAYELFIQSGSQAGRDVENWLSAERSVDRELQQAIVVSPRSDSVAPEAPVASEASAESRAERERTRTSNAQPRPGTPVKAGGGGGYRR